LDHDRIWEDSVRVCCLADVHRHALPDVPSCDLLLIAGDIATDIEAYAEEYLVDVFEPWLLRQPASDIVGIAGNHDTFAQHQPERLRSLPWTYLDHEAAVVRGYRIFGTPWTPQFGYWAFMTDESTLAEMWRSIPDDTEILLSHGPPEGYVDLTLSGVHAGSQSLLDRVRQLEHLKLLCCGHIHEAAGVDTLPGGAPVVNASVVDADYKLVRGARSVNLGPPSSEQTQG
jgi:Icc-related predicted phosphoesterase